MSLFTWTTLTLIIFHNSVYKPANRKIVLFEMKLLRAFTNILNKIITLYVLQSAVWPRRPTQEKQTDSHQHNNYDKQPYIMSIAAILFLMQWYSMKFRINLTRDMIRVWLTWLVLSFYVIVDQLEEQINIWRKNKRENRDDLLSH